MKKAIIMMIVVFALVVWPFSGVWRLCLASLAVESRILYLSIYGGIILLSGIIVVCTELILEDQIVKRRYKR